MFPRSRVVEVFGRRLVEVTLSWLRHIILLWGRLIDASFRRWLVEVFLGR